MEGVAGLCRDDQTNPDHPEYQRFRSLMAGEVNAAIAGALDAGVQEVVVNDGHWRGDNLLPNELHPAAELLTGSPKPFFMTEGMVPGFDAAFFVGYHASAGTQGAVIPHTYADPLVVTAVRLNGVAQSEGSLNGYLCGAFDCPVALFSGDAAAVSEMHNFCLEVEGVVVKEGYSGQAARSLHPSVAQERIRTAARRAIERLENIAPMRIEESPLRLEIDFVKAAQADSCERVPGVKRLSGRTVGYEDTDYVRLYRFFLALVDLASAWN